MAWSMLWKNRPSYGIGKQQTNFKRRLCVCFSKEFDGVWIWWEFRGNSSSLSLLTVQKWRNWGTTKQFRVTMTNQHSLRALRINIYKIFYIIYYIYYIYIIHIIHFSWKKLSLKANMTWWAKFSITVTDNPYIWCRH